MSVRSFVDMGESAVSNLSSKSEVNEGIHLNTSTELIYYPPLSEPATSAIIAFPGIVPRASLAFSEQIDTFREVGSTFLVDYPQQSFSIDETYKSIADCVSFCADNGLKVNLVGNSFGTRVITELLQNNPSIQKNINNIVFMGTWLCLDDTSYIVKRGYELMKKLVNRGKGFASYFKNNFNYDPFLDLDSNLTTDYILSSIGNSGLRARFLYFAEDFKLQSAIDIPATFIWWEEEKITSKSISNIRSLFPNSAHTRIPGIHGYLTSSANCINPIILETLNVNGHPLSSP